MPEIQRHRAAIRRVHLSRPLRLALEQELIAPSMTLFDYGCGHGDDVRRLKRRGFQASGWDPFHRAGTPLVEADVVYLGFVLNVIERPAERLEVLKRAWALAREVLVVGALVTADARGGAVPFGDGVVTSIGTFQKYFDQAELENVLAASTGVNPVALGLGAFALVRDPAVRTRLLARRFRGRRLLSSGGTVELFEGNLDAIQPVLDFYRDHGRWPKQRELAAEIDVSRVGGLGRAITLLQRTVPSNDLDLWRQNVMDNLRVFQSAMVLSGGLRMMDLDQATQSDIRVHFGTMKRAREAGEELLFSVGSAPVRRRAARRSPVGKCMPDALYVHESALPALPPELRVFEACARRFLGGSEGANLVKLRFDSPLVSYLSYPDFDKDPHPRLARSLRVDLRTFKVAVHDYERRDNPPILHRKEEFVEPDHPLRAKFGRLTEQEERWDLYDGSTGDIGTLTGWERRLLAAGVHLKGHRVCRGCRESQARTGFAPPRGFSTSPAGSVGR